MTRESRELQDSRFQKLMVRVWNSPTFMTWGSLAARLANLTVLLPFVLHSFPVEETSLWLLLSSIISLQLLVDLGFSQTFARAVAYAFGGVTIEQIKNLISRPIRHEDATPNVEILRLVVRTMGAIYGRLALLGLALMLTFGSMAVTKPIFLIAHPSDGLIAWGLVVVGTIATLHGNQYSAYLMGAENIALLRRWEIVTALGSICTSVVVLFFMNGGLLALVAVTQFWQLMAVVRNRHLARMSDPYGVWSSTTGFWRIDATMWSIIWSPAWRSGIGVLLSFGLIQLSGVAYAQVASSAEVAAYLLALRIMQTISQFSQAPFYSKIPTLARLCAQGNQTDLVTLAQHGMRLSLWTFVIGFIVTGIAVPILLPTIGSKTPFVTQQTWVLIGAAFLIERIGAMHLQMFSVTNRILWHIANGVTGGLMVVLGAILYPMLGLNALPLAMLIAYGIFYCTYSMWHSYRAFGLSFPHFEFRSSAMPSISVLLYSVARQWF